MCGGQEVCVAPWDVTLPRSRGHPSSTALPAPQAGPRRPGPGPRQSAGGDGPGRRGGSRVVTWGMGYAGSRSLPERRGRRFRVVTCAERRAGSLLAPAGPVSRPRQSAGTFRRPRVRAGSWPLHGAADTGRRGRGGGFPAPRPAARRRAPTLCPPVKGTARRRRPPPPAARPLADSSRLL